MQEALGALGIIYRAFMPLWLLSDATLFLISEFCIEVYTSLLFSFPQESYYLTCPHSPRLESVGWHSCFDCLLLFNQQSCRTEFWMHWWCSGIRLLIRLLSFFGLFRRSEIPQKQCHESKLKSVWQLPRPPATDGSQLSLTRALQPMRTLQLILTRENLEAWQLCFLHKLKRFSNGAK